MKNKINVTMRSIAIIALIAAIGFSMAACGTKAPTGTYRLSELPSWTITFGQGTFSMLIPADIAPSGSNTTLNGTFTLSGKTLILSGLDQPMTFTITNSKTLTESDGSLWKK